MKNFINKTIVLLLMAFLLFAKNSCKTEQDTIENDLVMPETESIDSTGPLYPFIPYIISQIKYVDSTLLPMEKTVQVNDKLMEPTFISIAELSQLATNFTSIDPNHSNFRSDYIENSYQDLTIGKITFSIVANKPGLELQQADILLDPFTQKIKNIILKKQLQNADSSIIQNLLWVHNMHFQISEWIEKKDGSSYSRITRVVWDKPF